MCAFSLRRLVAVLIGLGTLAAPPVWADAPAQPTEAPRTEAVPADPVERRAAEFTERTRRMMLGDAERTREARARRAARANEMESLSIQLSAAMALPPASTERQAQIDQTAQSLQNLVDRILDDRAQAMAAHAEAERDLEAARAEAQPSSLSQDERLAESRQAFIGVHEDRTASMLSEIDGASENLVNARALRRSAVRLASSDIRDAPLHLSTVKTELKSIPLDIASASRRTLDTWRRSPAELDQVQALGGLFLGLMQLAMLLVLGMWVHGRLPRWTSAALNNTDASDDGAQWTQRRDFPRWMVPGDWTAMAPPLGRVLQDVLVGGVGISIILWLNASVPLLAWFALIFVCGAVVRLGQGLLELTLVTPEETRPALRVVDPTVRAGMMWAVKVLGLLAAVQVLLTSLLSEILGADAVAALFAQVIQGVAILAIVVGLVRWGDALRQQVAIGGSEGPIASWILNRASHPALSVASASAALILVLVRFLASVLHALIESRAGLAWLGALLARRHLHDDASKSRAPLSLAVRSAIGQSALSEVNLDEPMREAATIIGRWTEDPRRGLIAVTGDRGMGKSVLMSRLASSHQGHVITAHAPIGHTQETQALNWLIRELELGVSPSTEAVVAALRTKPRALILLSNLHRLFLRAVGHYQGIDAVLNVMQATADHHFWVASFHGPSWAFLRGMDHVGQVGIFQHQIHLAPMTAPDMSAWLHAQTRRAQLKPRFDSLLQRDSRGPDRARRLERTERAFWRLMVDISQGNPTVAARIWVDCLSPGAEAGDADVGIPRTPDSDELESLSDDALFTLTAIILHEDIEVQELSLVLNLSDVRVRAICRGLEQASLITTTDANRYKVRLNWLPATERHLRRRSFLHKG